MCVCERECVCACVRKRESVYMCVCERERQTDRETETDGDRQKVGGARQNRMITMCLLHNSSDLESKNQCKIQNERERDTHTHIQTKRQTTSQGYMHKSMDLFPSCLGDGEVVLDEAHSVGVTAAEDLLS